MHYNGSYWQSPTTISTYGQYPSILIGNSNAKYVWTDGHSSPYEVKMSSESLNKLPNQDIDKKDYYERSIAWLDSSKNYIELRVKEMALKFSKKRILKIPS